MLQEFGSPHLRIRLETHPATEISPASAARPADDATVAPRHGGRRALDAKVKGSPASGQLRRSRLRATKRRPAQDRHFVGVVPIPRHAPADTAAERAQPISSK